MLIRHEGVRLKIYKDSVGIPSIGVGRNLQDRGITRDEAMYLLDNDIKDFSTQLYIKLPWLLNHPIEVQNVLLDMGFNLGIDGLLEFKNTLRFIQIKDYKKAAENMLMSKWAAQVGDRSLELANILKTII